MKVILVLLFITAIMQACSSTDSAVKPTDIPMVCKSIDSPDDYVLKCKKMHNLRVK